MPQPETDTPRDRMALTGEPGELRIVAWEVTRRCYLNCKHCRGAARDMDYEGELTTAQCKRLVDVIAEKAKPMIILTGGEPMSREDIYEIAATIRDKGLRAVLSPCGWLLDDVSCGRLLDAGIDKISISLDGHDAESHDRFRGVEGAFEKTLKGVEAAKRAGIAFQINTTITTHNVDRLADIYRLAVDLGADLFNPFMLVPSGRGRELAAQSVTPEAYEEVLAWIFETTRSGPIPVRPTCAPHYERVARKLAKEAGAPPAHRPGAGGHPGDKGSLGGCLGGRHFLFVSHTGTLQICGFLDIPCGNVKEADFDLWRLWRDAEVFRAVRDPARYEGKCGACEFLPVCRGCRARAYAMTGNYMEAEPFCSYVPKRLQR